MSDLDLDKLQAVCDAATPGPWEVNDHKGIDAPGHSPLIGNIHDGYIGKNYVAKACDLEMVIAARTAMPQLIARIRELEAALSACDNSWAMAAHENEWRKVDMSTKDKRIVVLEAKIAEFIDGENNPDKFERRGLL